VWPEKETAPRVLAHPGTWPTDPQRKEATVDTTSIREPRPKVPPEKHLAKLEERYRHELIDAEERLELRKRILRLRRRLGL
jgi:hypothetical protein